jgi:hypothetical protein
MMNEPVVATNRVDMPGAGMSGADVYRSALVRAFLWQVFFALLASLMLDGGIFRRVFCAVSVVYWLGVLVVLMVRPGESGLRYLRHGVLVVFGLTVLAIAVGHEWIVDVASR